MQVPEVMPTLPGRSAHDRGWVSFLTWGGAIVLLLVVVLLQVNKNKNLALDAACVWIVFVAAALLADARASLVAFREAQRADGPRAINRWDVAGIALAFGSSSALATVLAVRPHAAPAPLRVLAMSLGSAALLAWFLARAHRRIRLPTPLLGWPLDKRGDPRVPRGLAAASPHGMLGMCAMALGIGDPQRIYVTLFAPIWLAAAAVLAGNTRRASDAWWGRPSVGFGVEDALQFACGQIGLLLACAVMLGAWGPPDGWAIAWVLLLVIGSLQSIVRLMRRWKQRTAA